MHICITLDLPRGELFRHEAGITLLLGGEQIGWDEVSNGKSKRGPTWTGPEEGLPLPMNQHHSLSRDHFPRVDKIWAEENSDSSKRPQILSVAKAQLKRTRPRPGPGLSCAA